MYSHSFDTNARVGVVVIGRNEGARLVRCLRSVCSQVPRSAVVYVDSGSTDESVANAQREGVQVLELDPARPFSAARARNEGFDRLLQQNDSRELVQFVDGDCELTPGWIDTARRAMSEMKWVAILCGVLLEREPQRSVYNRLCAMEWQREAGEISWCGGIFMARSDAFRAVGGLRTNMIAGEEPELCARLRSAGWSIRRIDQEMATHDAAMLRFGQWWMRSSRAGYGWAERAALHGLAGDRAAVKEVASIFAWGLLLPLVALGSVLPTQGMSLALLAAYPVQWLRICRSSPTWMGNSRDAALYATFTLLGKLAGVHGVLRFTWARIRRRPEKIIEHKQICSRANADYSKAMVELAQRSAPAQERGGIAYLNSCYPSISHTFIEREIASLRARGVGVVPFSIRRCRKVDRIGEANAHAADETTALLDRPHRLLIRAAGQMIRHPLRALRAMSTAQLLSPPGVRERFRHAIYAIEAARLAVELRRAHVSHIHVHMANNGAMVALLACEHDPALRYSLSIHGSAEFFNMEKNVLAAKAERALFVRCISNFCRAQVMAWTNPEAWRRFYVVQCGIDPGAGGPREVNDHNEVFRFIAVGRLHPIKGYALLLRACRLLKERCVDWQLDLVGDGMERERLERLADELGIADQVRFHGPLSAEDVLVRYESCDAMVLSSFMEGVPIVLMEAMSRGLPVVATRVGGVAELVEDGVSGLLVAPGSVSQLGQAMQELAGASREVRAEMGRAGRQRVVEQYNRDRLGEQMLQLFQQHGILDVEHASHDLGDPVITARKDQSTRSPRRRYVLISPCRNEAAYMRETLKSVLQQTVRPTKWIIVDDGSSDASLHILQEFERQHEFIQVIRREDRGRRSVGPGVVDAVNTGLDAIALDEFDYVCKLDLDLRLPSRYFEALIERMETDERLGTCSGKPYFVGRRGRQISEMIGDDVSAGMTKFYRVECFRQIGGFVREVMWDGIDCHRCRMNGWRVRSWDEPELRFLHLRPMGSSQQSIWSGRFRHGYGQWFMGTSLAYMAASALFRMSRPPFVIGGVAMLCGYLSGMAHRLPRYPDAEFRRFLRSFQRCALLHGKGRAIELAEAHDGNR